MSASNRNAPSRPSSRRRVRDTAAAILDGTLCITAGARVLRELAFDLGAEWEEPFVLFVGIDSETDAFPLDDVRTHWSATALAREDAAREKYEDRVRPEARVACAELMRRYQWPTVV